MEEMLPIIKCPIASTAHNETPENLSRTVVGERNGSPRNWPRSQQSLDKSVQNWAYPISMSCSLYWSQHGFPLLLLSGPFPLRVSSRATEELRLLHLLCSAHPGLSMQPFFTACGNPLPPAPTALQIKPRVILVWPFFCLSLPC